MRGTDAFGPEGPPYDKRHALTRGRCAPRPLPEGEGRTPLTRLAAPAGLSPAGEGAEELPDHDSPVVFFAGAEEDRLVAEVGVGHHAIHVSNLLVVDVGPPALD